MVKTPRVKLTVLIRDPSPMVHYQEAPNHRTVTIELTDEQLKQLRLLHVATSSGFEHYEEIASCFVEEDGE